MKNHEMRSSKHDDSDCPAAYTLAILSGKWKVSIFQLLCRTRGPLRFTQLRRVMPKVSQRMLSRQLRELEADGIIIRKELSHIPLRVEYALTARGKSLSPIVNAMCEWAETHRTAP